MTSWLNILLLMMSGSIAEASMSTYHQQGKSVGQSVEMSLPRDAPHYQGKNVPEAKLKAKDLAGAVQAKVQQNPEAQFIEESLTKRSPYKIDVEKDPIFTSADEVVNNPDAHLNVTVKDAKKESQSTIHTCIEGKEEIHRSCTADLVPLQQGTKEEIQTQEITISSSQILNHSDKEVRDLYYVGWIADHPNDLSRLQKNIGFKPLSPEQLLNVFKKIYTGPIPHKVTCLGFSGPIVWVNKYTQSPQFLRFRLESLRQAPQIEMIWKSTCDDLEKLVDEGKCEFIRKHCTQGPQTRTIDGVPISKSCWQEQFTYSCPGEAKDTCTPLRKQGCTQISSKCLKEVEGECEEWEQTLECASNQSLSSSSMEGDKPFCLDGDCVEQGWAPNQDMADSLSKLAIFQHIQKDMDAKAQTVFKGKDLKCFRSMINFKDCCVKKGWGMDVGLASCSSQEKELAEERKLDKCIRIGTYCAEELLGKCIRKKTSYCCFGSKLARIIHEQGRQQLGLKFGSAKHPQCQGLTLDQLTKIDFSKIDLSELFKDMASKTKVPVMSRVTQGIQQSFQDRIKDRSHG